MTKIISIGTDRSIFKEGSAVRDRQIEYGTLFDELHVIVFTKQSANLPSRIKIASNVWVYGTQSFSKINHIQRATAVANQIIKDQKITPENSVITVQDPFECGLVGLKINKKFNIPLHVQIHTDFLSPYFAKESILNWLRVKIANRVLIRANAVRVVSKRIAESLLKIKLKNGVVPDILPIYVNLKSIENTQITSDLKKKYPQFNFIILMASRWTKEKNIQFALKVFSRVQKKYSGAGLVIVGAGPERLSLNWLVSKLNLTKNVIFENWQNDITSYYKTANMFLLTSNYEGYGLTLVEATASHCPVVSSDVGIAREILIDGIPSICPVGNLGCFVKNVCALIEESGLRLAFAYGADSRLESVVTKDKNEYLSNYRKGILSANIVV